MSQSSQQTKAIIRERARSLLTDARDTFALQGMSEADVRRIEKVCTDVLVLMLILDVRDAHVDALKEQIAALARKDAP